MKFSDFDRRAWETDGSYYDTCIIPYSGLQGTETPPETVALLERQRDFLELAEKAVQGEGRDLSGGTVCRAWNDSSYE
ncbi:hypothetical protein ACFTAO_29860 [Paenibacillus rhizoplanae]